MRTLLRTCRLLALPLLLGVVGCEKRSSPSIPRSSPEIPASERPGQADLEAHRLERIARETARSDPTAEPAPLPWYIQVQPSETEIIITRRAEVILQTNGIPPDGLPLDLAPGEYDLHLDAPGFSPYKERLVIRKNQQPLFYTLRRLTGELRIKGNAGTGLIIESTDGNLRKEGVTSLYGLFETRLPEGAYRVTFSKTDYRPASREIVIRQGEPAQVEVTLEGLPSSILLNPPVPVEILEGDQPLGKSGDIITNIPPGPHTFTLRADGYRTVQFAVQLPPNRFIPLTAPTLIQAVGALTIRLRSSLPDDPYFADLVKTLTVSGQTIQQTNNLFFFRTLPCGTQAVSIQVTGYGNPQEFLSVQVQDGRTQALERTMNPMPASVVVHTSPLIADVFQDGEKLGRSEEPLSVPPFQPLTLTIVREGFHSITRTVPALTPGTTTNLQADMEQAVTLEDLQVNLQAGYAETATLAPGSREAMLRQKQLVRTGRLPLEVSTCAGDIPLRLIPPGSFRMGSPFTESGRDDDETQPLTEEMEDPQPTVQITAPFYAGKYEITQRQWQEIMGSNPSSMKAAGPDAPVENVTWDDCEAFVSRLCELGRVPPGTYRLLTEAEWEYCCRAGTVQPTYLGTLSELGANNTPMLDRIAWYAGNCGVDYPGGMPSAAWPEKQYPHKTAGVHPVGLKQANAWGLYDMLGNVWEWCRDYYKSSYEAGPLKNPSGPEKGTSRVCRGAGWYTRASRFRAAERYANSPKYCDNNLGLRIMRMPPAVQSRPE